MGRLPELSSADPSSEARIAALQAELAAVKQRDAAFRTHMIQEFLDRGERNTYVHVLHEERAALRRREQESFADLELLVRKLEGAQARAAAAENALARLQGSLAWRLTAPLRSLRPAWGGGPAPAAAAPAVAGGVFTYYLHTSPFRIFREPRFTLRGWAWPEDGRPVTAVRVAVGSQTFIGRHGLPEPEVVARYGEQPHNPRPGFEVTFDTPPGEHPFSLEAQLGGEEWRWILRTTIWAEPRP
jgi:hypothetical protein